MKLIMNHYKIIVGVLFLIIFSTNCNDPVTETENFPANIDGLIKDLNLSDVSYLVSQSGNIIAERTEDNNTKIDREMYLNIIHYFAAPILLDEMLKDSLLNEDISLSKYLPGIKDTSLKIPCLLSVPANLDSRILNNDDTRFRAILKVIKASRKRRYVSLDEYLKMKLVSEEGPGIFPLCESLSNISAYFSAGHPEYHSNDTTIRDPFPTWYTQNVGNFFGWNVFKFQKQTILWAYFSIKDKSLLLLKYMDKDVFVALSYNSLNVISPYAFGKRDLLQSPVACGVIRSLLIPQLYNMLKHRDFYKSIAVCLLKSRSTPSHFLLMKDLASRIMFFENKKNSLIADKLRAIYSKEVRDGELVTYLNRVPLSEIDYISDNEDAFDLFSLKDSSVIQVFGGAQAMEKKYDTGEPSMYDNIQLFFNRSTDSSLIKREETQLIQFSYRDDRVFGFLRRNDTQSWLLDKGIEHAFSDPADSLYLMEVKIPWKILGINLHTGKAALALNIFIGDSDIDETRRESILSWSVKSDEYWDGPNRYGIVSLGKKKVNTDKKIIYSKAVYGHSPNIDGRPDEIWEQAIFSNIHVNFNGKPSKSDNSAKFKTLYDKDAIYFLFHIVDNSKNKPGIITKDKCWIEDAQTGELVWKMNGGINRYLPSFYVNQKIKLKAGNYRLRYTSDAGHSFEGWYGLPPENDIYGVRLYRAK